MLTLSRARVLVIGLSLFVASCAGDPPPTGPSALPAHGTPARIDVTATPGIGAHGGTATITARVQDAYAAILPDVSVTFTADAGTLSAPTAQTDANGLAASTLTASPGVVKVTAVAGSVQTPEVSVVVQPQLAPSPVPPQPPAPAPPVPGPINSPPPSDLPFMVAIAGTPSAAGTGTTFTLGTSAPLEKATWTFGDGTVAVTTTSPVVTHIYAQGGYTANVAAVDTKGRTASDSMAVTIPAPSYTVTVAASPASVAVGGTSTLTATVVSNGAPAITAWAWDCDGNGSTDAVTATTASCTYPAAGSFTARVTVTGGTVTGSATTTVTVADPVPVVTMNCGTVTAGTPTTCTVAATLSGAPATVTSVTWDFGDGSTPPTITLINTTQHTYVGAATYRVTVSRVTVTGTGITASISANAVVQ